MEKSIKQCSDFLRAVPLRVQVPKNHILTQNLYENYYYPNPKYLIIGYMDPLGTVYLRNVIVRIDSFIPCKPEESIQKSMLRP